MKTKLIVLAMTLLACVASYARVTVGQPAPAFEVKDVNGKPHKLDDFKGKVVVIEAINLDCPYSVNHYKTGAMQDLQAELTGKGAIWLAVNSIGSNHQSHRSADEAKKEIEQHKIKATAYLDDSEGRLGKAFGLKTTPHMVVIDQQGKVAYQGAIDDKPRDKGDPREARNYVREAVDKLLAGQRPEVSETKPYGCGIKYK